MAGDFRDPLVGRDLLVGGLLGLAYASVVYLKTLLHQWSGVVREPIMGGFTTEPLSGVGGIMVHFLHGFAGTVFAAVLASFLLLVLLTVLRKKRLAIAAFGLIILAPELVIAINGSWLSLPADILVAIILTIAAARFGLLALYSCLLFSGLSVGNPITSDFSSWYAGITLFAFVLLMSLAVYGFYTSLAGQKIFEGKFLKDVET